MNGVAAMRAAFPTLRIPDIVVLLDVVIDERLDVRCLLTRLW